jgi:hypothetical protein
MGPTRLAAMLAAVVAQGITQAAPALRAQTVPEALAAAGEHGEDLYDAAAANDWSAAERRLRALDADAARLAATAQHERLRPQLLALRHSIARRRRRDTMEQANQVTLAVADMTEPYAPAIPVEVTRLDCYGRELTIWSEADVVGRLEVATRGVRHEWDRVRPAVSARDRATAGRFEALVARLERGGSSGYYRRLAGRVLAQVDDLERVFAVPSSPEVGT